MSNTAVLEGVLERITYANEENGYTVARVDTGRGAGDLLTVVGSLLGAQPGESLRHVHVTAVVRLRVGWRCTW